MQGGCKCLVNNSFVGLATSRVIFKMKACQKISCENSVSTLKHQAFKKARVVEKEAVFFLARCIFQHCERGPPKQNPIISQRNHFRWLLAFSRYKYQSSPSHHRCASPSRISLITFDFVPYHTIFCAHTCLLSFFFCFY